LVRALSRIAAYQTPLVVTPAVERYLHDLATIETDPARRAALADVRAALRDSAAVRLLTGDLTYNALLAQHHLDHGPAGERQDERHPPAGARGAGRPAPPGQDPQAFLADLVRVVADSGVRSLRKDPAGPATESATDTELVSRHRGGGPRARAGRARTTPPLTASPTVITSGAWGS